MTFDNSRTVISLRIKLFIATVLFLTYIVLTYVANMIKYPILGISDTVWTFIFATIYLFVVFLPVFLKYQFISYSDDGEKIIFRYFSAGIVGGRNNSVEITKKSFSGYKTESGFFGLIHSIILFQRFKEGVAKYPPVYVTALNRKERARIFRSLDLCTPDE